MRRKESSINVGQPGRREQFEENRERRGSKMGKRTERRSGRHEKAGGGRKNKQMDIIKCFTFNFKQMKRCLYEHFWPC